MQQRRQDFALGLTAIAMLAVIVGTILFLRPISTAATREVVFQFRSEDGMAPLRSGSAVLLGGSIEVGRVRSVRIEQVEVATPPGPEKHTVFLVEARIRSDIPLYGDCEITTGAPTIGGGGYVLINNVGTPGVALTEPIEGRPPQTFNAAIASLSKMLIDEGGLIHQLNRAVDQDDESSVLYKILVSLDDLNAMTGELRVQLSPGERHALLAKLHRIIDHVNETTAALRWEFDAGGDATALAKAHEALDHLDEGMREAVALLKEDRPLIRSTLTSVEHLARTVDQDVLGVLREEMDRTDEGSLISQVHVAMERVNASLEDLNTMTSAGERMILVSRPGLEKTLQNFEDMSEQLRLASQEVLLNPSRLIWGPKPKREEQLVVFQAARSFAEAAGQLDTAAGRLEAVLQALPEDGRVSESVSQEILAIHQSVRGAFQRFERAEQALWDRLQ